MPNLKRAAAFLLTGALLLSTISGFALAAEALPEAVSAGTVAEYPADEEVVRAIVLLEDDCAAQSVDESDSEEMQMLSLSEAQDALEDQHEVLKEKLEQAEIDCEVMYEYTSVLNGLSVEVAYGDLSEIAEMPGVESVFVAAVYEAPVLTELEAEQMAETVQQLAMDQSENGRGTVIALLDSGMNTAHAAFAVSSQMPLTAVLTERAVQSAGTVAKGKYISAKIPFVYDYYDKDTNVTDKNGHGTHVAGLAAGFAADSGGAAFSGAAPAAQLAVMKIFGDNATTTTSDVYFAALEDAYRLGVDVVNLSLGTASGFTFDRTLESQALRNIYQVLEDAGMILCAACGNFGSQADHNSVEPGKVLADYADYGTLAAPASYPQNVSVAACNTASGGGICEFSSWGTTPELTLEPMLTACGKNLSSASNQGGSAYRTSSGTSMAAPIISGSFACLLSKLKREQPGMNKAERAALAKSSLISTASVLEENGLPISLRRQGAGLADLSAAVNAETVLFTPLQALGDDPEKTGEYTMSLTLCNLEQMAKTCAADVFGDVGSWDWYHESVDYVYEKGLLSGVSATEFNPNGDLTRGQLVTILHRVEGSPAVSGRSTFVDVPANTYYSAAVTWAQKNGIVNGVSDTEFAPEQPVTREQLVTVLYRYVGKPASTLNLGSYQDSGQVSSFAVDAMRWACEAKIITSTDASVPTLSPKNTASRAQFATILYRYLGGDAVVKRYTPDTVVLGDSTVRNASGQTMNTLTPRTLDAAVSYSQMQVEFGAYTEYKTVTVTVRLSGAEKARLKEAFPNGAFVEGYVSFRSGDEEIHAAFLAFFGDWEQAPVLEQADFQDLMQSGGSLSALGVNTNVNMAELYCGNESSRYYGKTIAVLGSNPFTAGVFRPEYMAISTANCNGDFLYADQLLLRTMQLRNANRVAVTVSNADTGTVYQQQTHGLVVKSGFLTATGKWSNSGAYYLRAVDAYGRPLPDGTRLKISVGTARTGETLREEWSFLCTVDSQAPTLQTSRNGNSLTLTVWDNQYLACVSVMDSTGKSLLAETFADGAQAVSHTLTVDLSGASGAITVAAVDYATNTRTAVLN